MKIKTQYITIFIFISVSLMSAFISKMLASTSMMVGVFITSSLIFILYIFKPIKINFSIDNTVLVLFCFTLIYCLSVISMVHNSTFEIIRFFATLALIAILLFLSYLFVVYLERVNDKMFFIFSNGVFIVLILDLIFSIFNNKEPLFFKEPSHLALIFLPFFLHKLLNNNQLNRSNIFFIFFIIAIAFLVENLTLLVGVLMITFISNKLKNLIYIISILGITLFFVNIDYFLSRLTFSGEITNLSVLVFLSGWERALLNFQNTFGLGIGLNQLGYIGTLGDFQEILSNLGLAGLNIYDGGSTASKLISELGFLGLFMIMLYLFSFFKFNILIKRYITFLDSKDIFFLSVFIMFSVELFIRGVGYFSPTVFLFLVSTFYINKVTYKKINKIKKEINVGTF